MAKDAFGVILTGLMKPIHVELANEAVDFLVPEILGQDNLLKFVDIFDDKILAGGPPEYNFSVFLILNNKSYTFNI